MNNIPFVRCVGIGVNIYQNEFKMAYDHRMICILSGDGTIEICDKLFETNTNDIFIINPGISYRVCSGENQKIAVVNFDTNYDFSYITDPVLSVDADKFQLDKISAELPNLIVFAVSVQNARNILGGVVSSDSKIIVIHRSYSF